jgi:hypothetical protein
MVSIEKTLELIDNRDNLRNVGGKAFIAPPLYEKRSGGSKKICRNA